MPVDWAFFLQGKVNEFHLQVPSILTHGPTPKGTFQAKWFLINACSAAWWPLGYSNELERRQSRSGGIMSAGDNSEQAAPNTNLGFSRTFLCYIRQGNGHFLLLHDRQNTRHFDLLLIRLLKMTHIFLLCTVCWLDCPTPPLAVWRWQWRPALSIPGVLEAHGAGGVARLPWTEQDNKKQSGSHLPPALLAALPAESRTTR